VANSILDFYRSLHLPIDNLRFSNFKIDLEFELNNRILDSIEVSKELTPGLYKTMQTLVEDLSLSGFELRFFIYNSSELQATCLASSQASAIINISSSLVDLMSENEIKFIIGHELGHLIFQHRAGCRAQTSNNIVSRIQELSCDRIGLLACGSLSEAISTIIKLSSGLASKHLRIDVSYYIHQVLKIDKNASNHREFSTHPAWLTRARSLVHFQAIIPSGNPRNLRLESLKRVNNQILKEMNDYCDYNLKLFAETAYENALFWLTAVAVVNQGRFLKSQQTILIRRFGLSKVDKLIKMLSTTSIENVRKICLTNIDRFREEFQNTSTISFESCIKESKDLLAE